MKSNPNSLDRLLAFDARLSRQLCLSPWSEGWRWARLAAHLGDGPLVFSGLGLVYGLGWLVAEAQLRQAVWVIALLVLVVAPVVTLIKFAVRRQRPQLPGEFVSFRYDAYSFPSGHAARMAALAVGVMFFNLPLGWSFIGLAVGVAVARVVVGIHYVSDVIAGLGLGALVAWTVRVMLLYFPG